MVPGQKHRPFQNGPRPPATAFLFANAQTSPEGDPLSLGRSLSRQDGSAAPAIAGQPPQRLFSGRGNAWPNV